MAEATWEVSEVYDEDGEFLGPSWRSKSMAPRMIADDLLPRAGRLILAVSLFPVATFRAPLFARFRWSGNTDAYRAARVPDEPFALPLEEVVVPNFATLRTVGYGARAAAAVVQMTLVMLGLIFQREVASGLTTGAAKV